MPKYIENVRERILAAAKKRLLSDGYGSFSVREIAGDCEIAVGTLYNYFQNKDMLIAYVMMEDWEAALHRMEEECHTVSSFSEGVEAFYKALNDFCAIYTKVWSQYSALGRPLGMFGERHLLLRGQLTERLLFLIGRFGTEEDSFLAGLLAELLLSVVLQPDITAEELKKMTDRLLG